MRYYTQQEVENIINNKYKNQYKVWIELSKLVTDLDKVDVATIKLLTTIINNNITKQLLKQYIKNIEVENKIDLDLAINKLSKQERLVILYYIKDYKQNEIVKKLGVSQRRISEVLNVAINKITNMLKE